MLLYNGSDCCHTMCWYVFIQHVSMLSYMVTLCCHTCRYIGIVLVCCTYQHVRLGYGLTLLHDPRKIKSISKYCRHIPLEYNKMPLFPQKVNSQCRRVESGLHKRLCAFELLDSSSYITTSRTRYFSTKSCFISHYSKLQIRLIPVPISKCF